MAELTTIARPYAEAVFDLAREQNALSVWSEMLRLAAFIAADQRVVQVVESPKLSAEEKASLVLSVAGDKLNESGRKFVRVLLGAGRFRLLPQIQVMYEDLKDEAEQVVRAHIESALPLSDAQVAELKASLQKRYGHAVETTVEVVADLVGGARIVVGDEVIDGSVRGKLAAMNASLHR